ncbi:hypothetical protein WKI71_07090 [Streptomyces sp. MS1.AVA.1]|uniref:Uncharacterized protein n=1 Tax=Streptomyces machairae TaxID=3134109 RepID=A0ABU8UIG0_9ACTN
MGESDHRWTAHPRQAQQGLRAPAAAPPPTPYVVGARLVDVPRLRAERATARPRPLPGPHWALPPAAWEHTGAMVRPYVAHLGAPHTTAPAGEAPPGQALTRARRLPDECL